jgi:hypothetical protein
MLHPNKQTTYLSRFKRFFSNVSTLTLMGTLLLTAAPAAADKAKAYAALAAEAKAQAGAATAALNKVFELNTAAEGMQAKADITAAAEVKAQADAAAASQAKLNAIQAQVEPAKVQAAAAATAFAKAQADAAAAVQAKFKAAGLPWKSCQPGWYAVIGPKEQFCSQCPAGTTSAELNAISIAACKSTRPGTYYSNTGGTNPLNCPVNTSSDWGATSCTTCPKDTWSNVGSGGCKPCPPGTKSGPNGSRCVSHDPNYLNSANDRARYWPGPYSEKGKTIYMPDGSSRRIQ